MAISAKAEISIKAEKRFVEILYSSLLPETRSTFSKRSSVTLEYGGQLLRINIDSSDIPVFRAALNSYLRWTDAILDVLKRMK